jgi:hypothetical protein
MRPAIVPGANNRHLLQIYEQALQAGSAAGKTEQASDSSFHSDVKSTCGFPLQTRGPQEPHRAEPSLCSSVKAGNCRLYPIPFTGSPRLSGIWAHPNAIHEPVPARTAHAGFLDPQGLTVGVMYHFSHEQSARLAQFMRWAFCRYGSVVLAVSLRIVGEVRVESGPCDFLERDAGRLPGRIPWGEMVSYALSRGTIAEGHPEQPELPGL